MNNEVVILTKILREFAKLSKDGRGRVVAYLQSTVDNEPEAPACPKPPEEDNTPES